MVDEVKWSDNAEFVPQSGISSTDKIMGLKSDGSINTKYDFSVLVNNFPPYFPIQKYVSPNGNNSFNGQIISPFLTIAFGDSACSPGNALMIPSSSFSEPGFSKQASVAWVGTGKEITIFSPSSAVTLDQVSWAAAANPYLYFSNMSWETNTPDLSVSTIQPNSSQIFDNVSFNGTLVTKGLSNLIIRNNCQFLDMLLTDIVSADIRSPINGTLSINTSDSVNVPSQNYELDDLLIVNLNVTTDGVAAINIDVRNCPNISFINITDPSLSSLISINFDSNSYHSPNISGDPVAVTVFPVDVLGGGTGLSVNPAHGKILVGMSNGQYDIANFIGIGGANVAYSEISHTVVVDTSAIENELPFGYWSGLHVSYVNTTTINMALGAAKDSTNVFSIYSTSNDLVITDSGLNGLDAGTIAPNTQYYIYNVGDSSGVNPGRVIASLSPVSPTLTSPYDIFRGIGSFQTNGSSQVIQNSIIDLINNAPLNDPSITGSLSVDTIVGRSSDLRINPSASGEKVYIGHDQADSGVIVGAGSTKSELRVANLFGDNFVVDNDGNTTVVKKLFANNNTPVSVYIDGINGVDLPGNGNYLNPYGTVSFAQSQITDATPSKPYVLIINSNITDTNQIYIKPNIHLFSYSNGFLIDNSLNIIAHGGWSTAAAGSKSIWCNVTTTLGFNVDFSIFTPAIGPNVQLYNYQTPDVFTFNGYASGNIPLTLLKLRNCVMQNLTYDNISLDSANSDPGPVSAGTISFVSGLITKSRNDIFSGFLINVNNANTSDVCSLDMVGAIFPTGLGNFDVVSNSIDPTPNFTANIYACDFGDNGFHTLRSINHAFNINVRGCSNINNITNDCNLSIDRASRPASEASFTNTGLVTDASVAVRIIDNSIGGTITMIPGTKYIVNRNVTFLLPAKSDTTGEITVVSGDTLFTVSVIQASGQQIKGGSAATTSGATGHLDFITASGHTVLVMNCVVDNTIWVASSSSPVNYV